MQQVLIVGRYRLLQLVGSGGMGRVWLARDEMLHRDVAIKEVVPPDWLTDAERDDLQERTMREARTAARLNHLNVVKIYDVVYAGSSPWIVMEYVPSRSLQEVLQSDGPLPPQRAAEIGLAVLAALRAAHAAGVLHRDVKPHNVLIADDGRVVLTDFGLATFDGEGGVTRPGMVMGSPQYVAPERAAEGTSSIETDLWSLGATLHAAVEGRSPYARPTSMATLTALATAPPDPAPHAGPLRPVLAGLLRRDPRRRLPAVEVERLLYRATDGRTARFGATAASPVVPPRGTPPSLDDSGGTRARRARRGWRAAAAVAALTVVAAAGTALAANLRRGDPGGTAGGGPTPSASATTTRAAAPAFPCTKPTDTGQIIKAVPRPKGEKYDLVDGFTWHIDPAGFRIAAPIGWRFFKDGEVSCIQEPGGPRVLSIDPTAPPTADPVGYWRTEEKRLTGGTRLAGYHRISIGPTSAFLAAAEWECTWTNAAGVRVHTYRMLTKTSANQAYAIAWVTPDFDWTVNNPRLFMIRTSFRPAT